MNRRLMIASTLAFGIAPLLSCDRNEGPPELRLGLLVATTGPSAERGLVQRNSAALAAEEINARGGVLGRPIRLVHGDEGSDLGRVVSVVSGILDRIDAPIVLGPVDTDVALIARDVIGTRALMLSASATANLGASTELRCLCASDVDQGRALAELVVARGLASVAIVGPETPTGRVLTDAFHTRFLELGGVVPLYNRYRPDREDLLSVVRPVGLVGADAILVDGSLRDASQIIELYLALYPGDGSVFLFTDEVESSAFVTAVGATQFDFAHLGIGPSTSAPPYAAYAAAYEARFEEPPDVGAHGASAYDAVYLAALAIEAAGTTDIEAIRAAIVEVAQGGTPYEPAAFEQARAALAAGDDIDFTGASGELSLAPPGPYENPRYDTWEVRSGEVVVTGTIP
jgi:branched-chain amino acid transport system substrate-binding protein